MKRAKTPTILQMEATECGAAALAIILAYYGRHIPLEKMRVDCGVSRDGCNASMMLTAARQHGLTAQAAKVDSIASLQELKAPVILFWEFNHFVVLEGISKEKIYINDPACGPRTVSYQQFDQAFTGVLLLLSPGTDFMAHGRPASLYSALRNRLQGLEKELFFVFIASLALVVPNLMITALAKVFIDNILVEKLNSWILPFFSVFLVMIVSIVLLSSLQNYFLLLIKLKLTLISTIGFLWRIMYLPIQFFQQRFAGDITERVSANDRIANLLSSEVMASLVSLVTIALYATIMCILSWPLALLAFTAMGFSLLVYRQVRRQFADVSRNFLQKNGKLLGLQMQGLGLIEDLKANGRENDFFQRWASAHAEIISLQQKQAIYNQILTVIPACTQLIAYSIITGLGSWQIINGQLTIGSLIAFQMLWYQFFAPLQTLLGLGGELQKIRGDLARLDDIQNHDLDPRFNIISGEHCPEASIRLDSVCFAYTANKPMLKELKLFIPAGEMIAILGKSGEGKSTIARLITGLYQPTRGSIHIGGTVLSQISPEISARLIAYVEQDVFLFPGTIRENISFWNPAISDLAIEKALHDACIYEEIMQRGGLDYVVSENGVNFSGGQRHRIEIARALAQNSKILILDEATSNLEAETEKRILKNIHEKGLTTLIITHRESALEYCRQIYKLEQGSLIPIDKELI
ncbi:cysteine peptidase family C39 domain-containing protein [Legionella sp. 16cNR16C]|uniref:cysteine peptidase family C39 domain-containing protein n=1 Tax=Legionella sp. 16cNR16C TaxID=2905656 RepID=UPI001E34CD0E|nr:cysteine peptidase family C39 domain-containing protein [Legionella sp. 16cNR16C]MCE3046437.1 cysteine peptidase family C39 domain-containing protein [Legionella sp. 16cNR16C]